MFKHIIRIFAYVFILCLANWFLKGSSIVLQGPLFIGLWGTWFRNNDNWPFAQKYGKIFNWCGLAACANGLFYLYQTYM